MTVTRQNGGTGLGWSISHRLAKLMVGNVCLLRSELGIGSCFRLELPLSIPSGAVMLDYLALAVSPPLGSQPSSQIALHNRILFAEDGIDNQRLLAFVLKKAGATVTVAENRRIALEMIGNAIQSDLLYDWLITNVQMPEMEGYALARALRERGNTIPIIALTAHAMTEARSRCLDAGCNDYLGKPIEKNQLLVACDRSTSHGSLLAK